MTTCSWYVYSPQKSPIGSYLGYKTLCGEPAKIFSTNGNRLDDASLCETHRKELNSLRRLGKLGPVSEVGIEKNLASK